MEMDGDSRVSPVSFLKAHPRMAIFLPVMLRVSYDEPEEVLCLRVEQSVDDLAGESVLLVLVLK